MATLKELNIKLGADTKTLQANMRKAANDLRREGRNFGQIGTELSLAVSLPLLGIGASAIKAAGDIEAFKMGFNTTMKAAGRSAQEAAKEMEALREIAKMPGIDFEQAIKGSMRLQGVGMSAEKARKIMEELANGISMAGGSAQEFDGVTRQLAQMSGKGRVLQEDLSILLENMPMLAKVLNDTFGTANADKLREMGVNAQDFIDGVTNGLSKLERVPGGLANSMVNFGVEVKMALATVGESINKAFNVTGKLEDFATWISSAAARFSNLSEGTQKVIIATLGFVAALGPAIKAISIYKNTKAAVIGLGEDAVKMFGNLRGSVIAATEKFQAMDKVTKATTIGMIAVAIAAAVLAYKALSESMSTAERVQKSLNEVQQSALAATAAERLESEALMKVIKDETATRTEKERAMKRLNEVGGEYFKGLSIEKSSVEQITAAYDKYIANLLAAARIKAAEEKMIDLEKRKLALIEAQNKAQEKSRNRLMAETVIGSMTNTSIGGFQQLGAIKAEMEAIEAQQKALAAMAYSTEAIAQKTTPGGPTFSGEKKTAKGKTEKEQVDAMKELAKAYTEIDATATALGDTYDAMAEKTSAVRNAIVTLIEQGVSPSDERIAMLSERYKNMTATLEPMAEQFGVVTTAMQLTTTVQDVVIEKANAMGTAFAAMGGMMGEAALSAASAMMELAATGETSFRRLGKAALKAGTDKIRSAIMSGVAQAVEGALTNVPFPFNLAAAGLAGAAAGVLFNKALTGLRIPALAEGAMVTKPTLALIGEAGPEMVIPPKKLPGVAAMAGLTKNGGGNMRISGEFRVKGTDLVLVLENAQQQQFRSFGR